MPSPKRIGKIEFGLLSPKEIRTMSVRKIIWADTYDDDGFPYPQGLMDLNLGVIDPGLRCKTCDQKASECRVYTDDTKTSPCDLPELQQVAPLA
jgi:DNA-directed RNA polymerase subunit A'